MIFLNKFNIILIFFCAFVSNSKAQDFKMVHNITDLEGLFTKDNDTTYVVNFWATWCKPCVKELPHFEAFNQQIGNKKIKVLLVSLDFNKQIDSHLKPFLTKHKLTSEVILMADKNYNQWLSKIDADWSGSIPATLVISKQKRLFAEKEFESAEELKSWVQTFIHP